jgi:DNA-binding LacI/PurR family transcriptional regulator
LGIATSTVSRALHNHPDVNEDTKKAIIEIANHLDYQPNQLAYNLVKRESKVIGMLVPEFIHVFFPAVIIGAQEVLSKAGYKMIIMQSNESYEDEVSNTTTLISSRIDGLIASFTKETNNYEHFKAFEKRDIPVVLFNRYCEEIKAHKIIVNDYEGAFQVVEHLVEQGYRRIAHMAGPKNLTLSQERLRGYRDALTKYDLPIETDLIIYSDFTAEKAKIYAKYFLEMENPPDAIFAVNDPSAIQIILMARSKGLKIPEQLGVAGFSNDPIAEFIEPGLTTVSQPTEQIGRLAAIKILELIKNEGNLAHNQISKLETQLIIRGSSCK